MPGNYKKKRRHVRKHLFWRIDYDYWDKLSDEEKKWLDTFTDEYYDNVFNELDPVHKLDAPSEYAIKHGSKRKGTVKQQLMYEEYIRRRDILYNGARIQKSKRPSSYSSDLYAKKSSTENEEAIVKIIDEKRKSAKDSTDSSDK